MTRMHYVMIAGPQEFLRAGLEVGPVVHASFGLGMQRELERDLVDDHAAAASTGLGRNHRSRIPPALSRSAACCQSSPDARWGSAALVAEVVDRDGVRCVGVSPWRCRCRRLP